MSANNTTIITYQKGDVVSIELWMIGVIISAMVYGGVLSLSLAYIPLLLKASHDVSRRMRNFLLVYVIFMVAVSTVYMITMIIALTRNIFFDQDQGVISSRYLFQNGLVGVMCTTLASWGADGFMLWRCAVIYEGVSRPRRIALLVVLIFMGLISLVSGLLNMIYGSVFVLVFIGVTVILNFVTAILITWRILYFDRYIQKIMGAERNSPYMTIVIICVESSALIVVFSLIYFIHFFQQANASNDIPMHLLVHVYVLSPLLIVYRVSRGKAITIRQRPSESGPVLSALRFESAVEM